MMTLVGQVRVSEFGVVVQVTAHDSKTCAVRVVGRVNARAATVEPGDSRVAYVPISMLTRWLEVLHE